MCDELRALLDGVPVMQGIAAWIIPLITALGGVGASALANSGSGDQPTTTAEQQALQKEMLRLINQQRGYMSEQDPLRQSVLRMAMGMMPIRYQTGLDYRSGPGSGNAIGDLAAKTYNRTGAGWQDRKEEDLGAPPRASLVGKRIDSQAYRDLLKDYYGGESPYQRPPPGE